MQRGPACCSGTVFRVFLQRAPGQQAFWRALGGQNQRSWSFAVTVPLQDPVFVQAKCGKDKGHFLHADAVSSLFPSSCFEKTPCYRHPLTEEDKTCSKHRIRIELHPQGFPQSNFPTLWSPSNVLLDPETSLGGRKRLLREIPGKGGWGSNDDGGRALAVAARAAPGKRSPGQGAPHVPGLRKPINKKCGVSIFQHPTPLPPHPAAGRRASSHRSRAHVSPHRAAVQADKSGGEGWLLIGASRGDIRIKGLAGGHLGESGAAPGLLSFRPLFITACFSS